MPAVHRSNPLSVVCLAVVPLLFAACDGPSSAEGRTVTLALEVQGAGEVTSTPAGISCGETCAAAFAVGTSVRLAASPAAGAHFEAWSGDCAGAADTVTLTLDAARRCVATFMADTFRVSVQVLGKGRVRSNVGSIDCDATCSAEVVAGLPLTLSAQPDAGSRFKGWGGDCAGTDATATVTVDRARNCTAEFEQVRHQVSVTVEGPGSVTSEPAGLDCGETCAKAFDAASDVVLVATPGTHALFTGWSGDCAGTNPRLTLSALDAPKSCAAAFAPARHDLTVTVTGNGLVTSEPAGIDCGLTCTKAFDAGSVVTLTAHPAERLARFAGWTGACTGTERTTTVTMDAAKSCGVAFEPVRYELGVTLVGAGSVTSDPAGIDCGRDCQGSFDAGTEVTLTAIPDDRSIRFLGWTGDCASAGTVGLVTLTLDGAKRCTASFTTPVQSLDVVLAGGGEVVSDPEGILCGDNCSHEFARGTQVTLTAIPYRGSFFAGWSGDCGGTGQATVTLDTNRSCTATFTPVPRELTVTIEGGGMVTSAPAGIDCGATCTASFPMNSRVTLTATASRGSFLEEWAGDCAGAEQTTTVTMSATRSCVARFKRARCEEFVVVDDRGRFQRDGQDFGFTGTNFHVGIGARVTNADEPGLTPDRYQWEYFLAPYGNYFPDNDAVCFTPWSVDAQCCRDEDGCQAMLDREHVQRLVSLGVNSVRLVGLGMLFDRTGPHVTCSRVWDQYSQRDQDAGRGCRWDQAQPAARQQLLAMIRRTVRLLGENGIRTIFLAGDKDQELAAHHDRYLGWLRELSTAMKDEPDLIAYDPMNEPVYAYSWDADATAFNGLCGADVPENAGCKKAAQEISKAWFQAIAPNAPNQFVTIGLGTPREAVWDPQVLYDHFSSWHVYPAAPWAGAIPESRLLDAQIYAASLTACGVECPYGGSRDTLGCKVAEGPVGASAFIYQGGFYYSYLATTPRCPVGTDDGANCQVGAFGRGRDTPVLRHRPVFYVEAGALRCPVGTTPDGTRCRVATGPIGTDGFFWGPGDGTQAFYYNYLSGPTRCEAPATDDGAHCRIANVPTGKTPVVVNQPAYYVEAIACGPRKPAHFGETGFAAFPNGTDLNAASYTLNTQMPGLRNECVQTSSTPLHGTESEQRDYLSGGRGWAGLFPRSHACGFQGLHWWIFGAMHWGDCQGDNFGLYHYWYSRNATAPGGDAEALVERPVAGALRAVDYTLPRNTQCTAPATFTQFADRRIGTNIITYTGRVLKAGQPVANAYVYSWDTNWGGVYSTYTDADGKFSLPMDRCLVKVGVTQFGHTVAEKWVESASGACPSRWVAGQVVLRTLGDFTLAPFATLPDWKRDLKPPTTRRTMCLSQSGWSER